VNLGKWEIVFWPWLRCWLWNWGYYPNKRKPFFFFINFGIIELRYFAAFNKKKVCKRCGQEMPASTTLDKEV
jgi:hypothetical protein